MTEFRNRTEMPDREGWHYARRTELKPITGVQRGIIEPVFVHRTQQGRLMARCIGSSGYHGLLAFQWFGPMTEIKEG